MIEAIGNIALDHPGYSVPGVVDLLKGRVTSPSFSEAM